MCLKDIRIAVVVIAILYFIPALSQEENFEKYVFTYKKVRNHEIKANILIPKAKQKHPVIVYFHGGGFIFGNRDKGLPNVLRDELIKHKYAVVSADYRLAPETKLDEIIKDVRDANIYLRKEGEKKFNINPDKIAVIGGSAAGYLALTTGYNVQPPPQAIIAISTPTDFSAAPKTKKGNEAVLKQPGPYDVVSDKTISHGNYTTRKELWWFLAKNRLADSEIFGFDVTEDTTRLKTFMLTKQITSSYPPTLLLHARKDHLVALSAVEPFEKSLKEKGIESELFLVEEGHSSELIKNNPEAIEKLISFLDKHLK
jgi:acetyl esterase/lipase